MQVNVLQNLIALSRAALTGERIAQSSQVMGALWAGVTEAEAELDQMKKAAEKTIAGPGSEQRAVDSPAAVPTGA